MVRIFALIWMLAIASFAPALAQTPAQQEVLPAAKLNLTLEQKHVIKELIKDLKVEPTSLAIHPTTGDALSPDAKPRPMPNEIGQKVPQIKAHLFLVTADQIVIVDPKDNKVAEVIELKD